MAIGTPEILVVLLIVLLLFGPKKLPELARGIGKAVSNFKKEMHGDSKERKG
jgi:sec-independent protein translocase protein TatA